MRTRSRGDITRQRARDFIKAGGGLRPAEIVEWYAKVTEIRNERLREKHA